MIEILIWIHKNETIVDFGMFGPADPDSFTTSICKNVREVIIPLENNEVKFPVKLHRLDSVTNDLTARTFPEATIIL